MNRPEIVLVSLPCDVDGAVFAEPWEARAFAIVVALHQRGVFTWVEWAAALAAAIKDAQALGDPDRGATYYRHWLRALENLLIQKGISGEGMLGILKDRWDEAARATPHGQPIKLAAV